MRMLCMYSQIPLEKKTMTSGTHAVKNDSTVVFEHGAHLSSFLEEHINQSDCLSVFLSGLSKNIHSVYSK